VHPDNKISMAASIPSIRWARVGVVDLFSNRMIANHGLPHVHAFVRDRTRAVRQDLRIQLEVPPGISIFQQCVRFAESPTFISFD
jgi:hypothetical protein